MLSTTLRERPIYTSSVTSMMTACQHQSLACLDFKQFKATRLSMATGNQPAEQNTMSAHIYKKQEIVGPELFTKIKPKLATYKTVDRIKKN